MITNIKYESIYMCSQKDKILHLFDRIETNFIASYLHCIIFLPDQNIFDAWGFVSDDIKLFKKMHTRIYKYKKSDVSQNFKLSCTKNTSTDLLRDLYCFGLVTYKQKIDTLIDIDCSMLDWWIPVVFLATSNNLLMKLENKYDRIVKKCEYSIDYFDSILTEIHNIYMYICQFKENYDENKRVKYFTFIHKNFVRTTCKVIAFYRHVTLEFLEYIYIKNCKLYEILDIDVLLNNLISLYECEELYILRKDIVSTEGLRIRTNYITDFEKIIKGLFYSRDMYIDQFNLLPQVNAALERFSKFIASRNQKKTGLSQTIKEYPSLYQQMHEDINGNITKLRDLVKKHNETSEKIKYNPETRTNLYIQWQLLMVQIVNKISEIYNLLLCLTYSGNNFITSEYFECFYNECFIIDDIYQLYPEVLFKNTWVEYITISIQCHRIDFIIHISLPYFAILCKYCVKSGRRKEEDIIRNMIRKTMCLLQKLQDDIYLNGIDKINCYYSPDNIDYMHESKYYTNKQFETFISTVNNNEDNLGLDLQKLFSYKFNTLLYKLHLIRDDSNGNLLVCSVERILEQMCLLLMNSRNIHIIDTGFTIKLLKDFYVKIYHKLTTKSIEYRIKKYIVNLAVEDLQKKINESTDNYCSISLESKYINYKHIYDVSCERLTVLTKDTDLTFKNMESYIINSNNIDFILFSYYIKAFIAKFKNLCNYNAIFEDTVQLGKYISDLSDEESKISSKLDYAINTPRIEGTSSNSNIAYYDHALIQSTIMFYINMDMLYNTIEKSINYFRPVDNYGCGMNQLNRSFFEKKLIY